MLQPTGAPSCDVIPFGDSHFKKCWLQRTQRMEEPPPPPLLLPTIDSIDEHKLAALMASHAHLPQALRSGFVGCSSSPTGIHCELAEQQSLTALLNRLVQKARSGGSHSQSSHKGLELKNISCAEDDPLSKEGPCLLNSAGVSDGSVVWPATPAGSAPLPAGNSPSCSSSGQNPCSTSQWEGDNTAATHETPWGTFRKRPRKGVRTSGSAGEASANDKLPAGARAGCPYLRASSVQQLSAVAPSAEGGVGGATKPWGATMAQLRRESSPSSANDLSSGGGEVELCDELSPRPPAGGRTCAHCGTQKTPLWRNGPCGVKSLCNACGIRYKKLVRKGGIVQAEEDYGPQSSIFFAHGATNAAQPIRPTTPAVQGKVTSGIRKRKQEDTAAALAASASDAHLADRSRYHEGVKAAGYDPSAHPRKRFSEQHKVKDATEGKPQRPRMRGNMNPVSYDDEIVLPEVVVKKEEVDLDGSFAAAIVVDEVDEEGAASALVALFHSI